MVSVYVIYGSLDLWHLAITW